MPRPPLTPESTPAEGQDVPASPRESRRAITQRSRDGTRPSVRAIWEPNCRGRRAARPITERDQAVSDPRPKLNSAAEVSDQGAGCRR